MSEVCGGGGGDILPLRVTCVEPLTGGGGGQGGSAKHWSSAVC